MLKTAPTPVRHAASDQSGDVEWYLVGDASDLPLVKEHALGEGVDLGDGTAQPLPLPRQLRGVIEAPERTVGALVGMANQALLTLATPGVEADDDMVVERDPGDGAPDALDDAGRLVPEHRGCHHRV